MENWYGVFRPAGTPVAIRDKLEQALDAVVALPTIKQRLIDNGLHGMLGHDAFVAALKQQFAQWPEQIRTLGITGD
jgi:tripartite-type tricarboxylate transporter receptor subunit TctC